MKLKLLIYLILFLPSNKLFCQKINRTDTPQSVPTFEKSFSTIEKIYSDPTEFPSKAINYNNQLHSYIAPLMNAYLEMYEASLDKHYLDLFIIQAKLVINRRDDNLKILYLDKPDSEKIVISNIETRRVLEGGQVPQNGDKAWSGYNEPYYDANPPHERLIEAYWAGEHVSNGIISFPLIKFAYLIKYVYPHLKTLEVPSEAKGPDASNGFVVNTYDDFAELLKNKIHETIHDHFGKYWSKKRHCYVDTSPDGPKKTGHSNINYHTSLGRPAVYLYAIYKAENNDTLTDYYHNLISEIFLRLTYPKDPASFTRKDHIVSWRYTTPRGSYEDIAHGLLSFQFVDLCHHFEIPNFFKPKNLLVPNDLMFDFANTFQEKFIKGPESYWLNISGDDAKAPNQPIPVCDNPVYDSIRKIDQYSNAGRTVFLSKHIPDLYPAFADYFYEFGLYGPDSSPKYLKGPFNQTMVVDAVAGLAHYAKVPSVSNHMNIKGVARSHKYDVDNHFPEKPKYTGVTSGEFDGNPSTIEIATIQVDNNHIEIHSYNDSTQKISLNTNKTGQRLNGNWDNISAGNIIPGNESDELVAYSQDTKCLYVILSNKSVPIMFYTGKQVSHIAVGNIDNQPGDEIITISGINGEMSIYRFKKDNLEEQIILNSMLSPFLIYSPAGIAIGNLDNDPSNGSEIITIDNNIYEEENIRIFNFNSNTNQFYNHISTFSGTRSDYSNWNGIAVGDYNNDGIDEFMLHREFDGDFFLFHLEAGKIKNSCKDYYPINWEMGIMCTINSKQNEKDYFLTIRNLNGDLFIYEPVFLPRKLENKTKTTPSETNIYSEIVPDPFYDLSSGLIPYHIEMKTQIIYTITSPNQVEINVYDILGYKQNILKKEAKSGIYTFYLDHNLLKNGMYFLELKSGSEIKTIKLKR